MSKYSEKVLAWWVKFWRSQGIEIDVLCIPEFAARRGFRPIVVPGHGQEDFNLLFAKCREHFPCWRRAEHDSRFSSGTGVRKDAYVVFVSGSPQALCDGQFCSDVFTAGSKIRGITLNEQLAIVLKRVFLGKPPLDEGLLFLCPASKDEYGGIPYVCWRDGKLRIYICKGRYQGSLLRYYRRSLE